MGTANAVETWAERMARLRRQHRLYLTAWVVGDPEGDRLAARHERDVAYAARRLEIPVAEMLARLDPEVIPPPAGEPAAR